MANPNAPLVGRTPETLVHATSGTPPRTHAHTLNQSPDTPRWPLTHGVQMLGQQMSWTLLPGS
eukprot:9406456-Lingulodinium_polyedra.AAC.1